MYLALEMLECVILNFFLQTNLFAVRYALFSLFLWNTLANITKNSFMSIQFSYSCVAFYFWVVQT